MGATPMLAEPVRWTWLGICVLALGVHLRHAREVRGSHRLWHGGHAFMAAAMAWMLLPTGLGSGWAPLWFIGGVGGAGAAVVHALLRRWDGVRIDLAWITLAVGLGATAYMCLMLVGVATPPLTYVWAACLCCETLGWFTGVLSDPRRPGPARAAPPDPTRTSLAGEHLLVAVAHRLDRLALGLLGLAMAYLFVAMQQASMSAM